MHLEWYQLPKSVKCSVRQTITEQFDAAKIETLCDAIVNESSHVFTPIFIGFHVAHEVEPELWGFQYIRTRESKARTGSFWAEAYLDRNQTMVV